MFDVDLFVIGGGSGGVRAARIAAGHGAKVALAEESRMGGTCVIRGCVPKKLMVFASGYPAAFEDAAHYGWQVSAGDFDWGQFRARLGAELDRLEGLYRAGLVNAGVTVHDSRATLVDPHTVRLADGTELRARHILIATGGRPFVPDFPGREHVLVSDDIFNLERLPESVLIVGGGFIACEFACILQGLGVEVTQYYRGAQILRGFDDEARGHVAELMQEAGIRLHVGCDVEAIEPRDGGYLVRGRDGSERVFGAVLYATGRVPNTDGLGLEAAGITPGRRGEVPVDEWSQTVVPSIHAVGDVTDRIALTPVAIREGHAFADTLFGNMPRTVDHGLVAAAVFTQPCELGAVGLTEEAAREKGPIHVYQAAFRPMRQSFAGRSMRVMMKLVVCAQTDRVLGCHIVAPEAGEMIQLAAVAIGMGATKADFDRTCAVHPTMAEELVTMRNPVRTA
ncbi:glutathione-disulfide reductase [Phaeovulum vinaykumarii]|uniref:NADPH-glutathione reductase n=1 Tax=Phaeovulum vinaykumarii TaxID=407234 RepID=A0A1N7JL03_9RHOB|nr:glutathione-disulfide reductase [Phaeovulum vinaykumarii]SIS49934.1 NADPH-glutathione reductase [Phaeovulum vinaykumarii]SOB90003.1 NADPH-glutathione reductase [Phaeovulum vinaykumarii]